MKRNLILATFAAITLQAGSAFAGYGNWTFDEPYWKQPIVAGAKQDIATQKLDAGKSPQFSFLTDYSN